MANSTIGGRRKHGILHLLCRPVAAWAGGAWIGILSADRLFENSIEPSLSFIALCLHSAFDLNNSTSTLSG
jgi:hypothetical protein